MNGVICMVDEEVTGIPDYLDYQLQIVFIGFNPGLTSARTGHHYASPTNRFWKLLFESGLTPVQYQPGEDYKLLEHGLNRTPYQEQLARYQRLRKLLDSKV